MSIHENELDALKIELESLRAFKAEWDNHFPGLTPQAVKNMEQQLHAFYSEHDEAGDVLKTTYQQELES